MLENMEPKDLARVIADTSSIEMQAKFIKGQHEHGGDFALKPTVKNIREEVLDLVNYTHILNNHRATALIKLDELMAKIQARISNKEDVTKDIISDLREIRSVIHDL